ncbi:serine/arginine-rich splicing factor 2-like [Orycteropus afer afer]|uniref:Serine/arginine-rich splicing factor 2-like n=1 Tax=Orycteropus afer afer TaxID=1230840 RepID=A0AC54ZDJ5_ORYAF|nr:serine/arginine-rich splicing factor 2-like [Orycteropus afer afer]
MISLKVDNLACHTLSSTLRRLFERYGNVGDVYIPRDPITNKSRSFGFVRFYNRSDAEVAMHALHRVMLHGRELWVQMARYGRHSHPRCGRHSDPRHGRLGRPSRWYREDGNKNERRSPRHLRSSPEAFRRSRRRLHRSPKSLRHSPAPLQPSCSTRYRRESKCTSSSKSPCKSPEEERS